MCLRSLGFKSYLCHEEVTISLLQLFVSYTAGKRIYKPSKGCCEGEQKATWKLEIVYYLVLDEPFVSHLIKVPL